MRVRAAATLLLLGLTGCTASAQDAGPDRQNQIEQAVLAAPESLRASASVLGYGGEPRETDPLTLLRAGSNGLVCLADDPATEGFHASCYHESLEPFMSLGRRLRAEGKGRDEVMSARYEALEAGDFRMPKQAALYSISSDAGPGDLDEARRLVVVYVPGATAETLGLPTRPEGDSPWLMLPGTPWAHIMIGR
jgi:hypothetical protein